MAIGRRQDVQRHVRTFGGEGLIKCNTLKFEPIKWIIKKYLLTPYI